MVEIGNRLCARLETLLTRPLPGRQAQITMVPPGRSIPNQAPKGAREGAVLIAFLPTDEGFAIPLIERAKDGGPHGGQIALPGGAREQDDNFPTGTALREAEEEIGIPAGELEVTGHLTPLYISVSNFLIVPVIACGHSMTPAVWDTLVPEPREVRRILPVDPTLLEDSRDLRVVRARNTLFTVPSYRWKEDTIWGATAIILAELCHLLATEGPQ